MTASTTPDVTADVCRTLAELGTNADQVADSLRARAIKGFQNFPECCPIANLLTTLPGVHDVEVSEAAIQFAIGDQYQEIDTPEPVEKFVRNFDDGIYLDLVDRAEAES